ncbi:MAG TPA: carboxypeptidase-like regulatory domain-containing protein, partial [Candidatus Angelobacter sp.]|nr:carboxypeptidase-like regulatory domain-containing protein [Candidatus Angelobacter sp.]
SGQARMAIAHRTILIALALAATARGYAVSGQDQQSADAQTAVIEGTVLNIQNSRTIPHAVVNLRQTRGGQSKATRSDGNGHFVFRNVDAGSYRLTAERQGFFSDDRKREYQPVIDVSAGEHVKNVPVRLMPAAVLAGEIVDEFNDPVQDIEVRALAMRVRLGQMYLNQAGKMTTDDRGQYRIAGLHPGKYYLVAEYKHGNATADAIKTALAEQLATAPQANARPGPNAALVQVDVPDPAFTYPPMFYPATGSFQQAQPVSLRPGDEVAANFVLISTPVVSIRGRVTNGINGAPAGTASVSAYWTPYMESDGMPARVSPQDGTFEIRGVAPGTYTLRGSYTEDGLSYAGEQTVEVGDQGAQNVEVSVLPDFAAAGHVTVAGIQRNPLGRVVIEFAGEGLLPRIFTSARAPEYKFETQLRPERRYRAVIRNLQEDYYLKSVTLAGHDVPPDNVVVSGRRGEIELVLSPAGGHVEGLLFDAKDQPTRGSVLLAPDVPEPGPPDLFRRTSADGKGKFTFRGIAPGSYRVVAMESLNLDTEINSPDFFRTIGNRGQNLIVEENGKYSVAIKLEVSESR